MKLSNLSYDVWVYAMAAQKAIQEHDRDDCKNWLGKILREIQEWKAENAETSSEVKI